MRRDQRKCRRQAGFTLLETIVVVALLSLLVGMGSHLFRSGSERLRVETAMRELCATLRATRARAIATNAELALAVDIFNKSYVSPAVGGGKFPSDFVIVIDVANTQRLSSILGAVTFYPDGASTGGDIILQTPVARGTVRINWLTGDVKCVLG